MLIKPGDRYDFKREDFTNDYFDLENDSPYIIRILNLPNYGLLIYENKPIKINFEFDIANIDNFKYIRISNQAFSEDINFQISDNNPNKLFSEMATFTINTNAYVNLPPDQLGDNEVTIVNGGVYVFTVESLTSNLVPPYEDPENDPPYKLKVLSLPAEGGKLTLDGVDVVLNQEIFFSDIADGLFVYTPPPVTIAVEDPFDFTVSDTGSQEFYTP